MEAHCRLAQRQLKQGLLFRKNGSFCHTSCSQPLSPYNVSQDALAWLAHCYTQEIFKLKSFDVTSYAVCVSAVVGILAGCSGGAPTPPGSSTPSQLATLQSVNGPLSFNRAARSMFNESISIAQHANHRPSWMASDATKSDLVYIVTGGVVDVFTFPTLKPVGELTGFVTPVGACSDNAGNVWIVDQGVSSPLTPAAIYEFAHGGTSSIATLKDPGYAANACSVDPTTGNLAVANIATLPSSGAGNVAIYTRARGKPTFVPLPSYGVEAGYDAYDGHGNLFLDFLTNISTKPDEFAVFAPGRVKLHPIALPFEFPGAMQWDGQYLAVNNQSTNAVYQFSIVGRRATQVGSTTLGGLDTYLIGFWKQGSRIVGLECDCADGGAFATWNYPAGGSPKKRFKGKFAIGEATTVSVAKAAN